jgi:hypothetical protein
LNYKDKYLFSLISELLVEGLLGLYQEQAIKPLYYEAAS